jgi:hypothetical protein
LNPQDNSLFSDAQVLAGKIVSPLNIGDLETRDCNIRRKGEATFDTRRLRVDSILGFS